MRERTRLGIATAAALAFTLAGGGSSGAQDAQGTGSAPTDDTTPPPDRSGDATPADPSGGPQSDGATDRPAGATRARSDAPAPGPNAPTQAQPGGGAGNPEASSATTADDLQRI